MSEVYSFLRRLVLPGAGWGLFLSRQGKRILWCGWLLAGVGIAGHAQEPGFHLEGTMSRCLPVTGRKMTNVIFPVDIAAGVRVSRDVLVQKVRGVENVIELKALKRGFAPTSLAVYGKDGRLYSFVLHYVEDTTVLDFRVVADGATLSLVRLSDWPVNPEQLRMDGQMLAERRGFLHRRAVSDGLCLRLKGTYLRDSLLWLSLEVREHTAIGFQPGMVRVWSEDRKKVRRMASQEVEVSPVYTGGSGPVFGFGRRAWTIALRPMVIGKGQQLVVEVLDEVGRQVRLTVKRRMLLRARKG
ncbi:MAG TPA: DUF4138 domain-containing protein [Puia sp.]|jgi:hypothetical protein